MRRLVMLLSLLLVLSACGREATVDLASGDTADGEGTGSTVDVPEESEDDSWANEPAVEETFEDGDATESAEPDQAEQSPKPTSTATRVAAKPKPAENGSSQGGTGGSQPSQGGATTPPNQGIAVGEPNPNDPDGCPECPVSSPTEEPGPAPGGGGYTNPAPGQDDVRAREWESAQVQADDQTIVITWWSGVEPCYVLDHVEVVEESERIVLTLYEGHQPGFEGACTEQAVKKQTEVRVSSKVAGRTIVDGAKK